MYSARVMILARIDMYRINILETREELERDKEMTQLVDSPSNDVTIVVFNQTLSTMIEKNGGRNGIDDKPTSILEINTLAGSIQCV